MSGSRGLILRLARGLPGALLLGAVTPLALGHRLAVLTYHRIAADRAAEQRMAPGLASATVAEFEEQLRDVSRRFSIISLEDVLELRENGRPPAKRTLALVTFDDAYRDFAELAWPVIRRIRVPVAMFVPTAFPDAGVAYWWDQLAYTVRTTRARDVTWDGRTLPLATDGDRGAAYRAIHGDLQVVHTAISERRVAELAAALDVGPAPAEVLGWDELRQLVRDGLTVGAHSHAHRRLDRLDAEELAADLENCRATMAKEFGNQPRTFAYPTGFYDDAVARAVGAAGFAMSFTTDRGVGDQRRLDWYRLPRINVGMRSNARLLSLQALLLPPRRAPQDHPPS